MTHELVAESKKAQMLWARQAKNAPERLVRLFWAKVVVSDAGCWIWTGASDAKGYGRVRRGRRNWLVTRYVWTELIGPIPEGLMVLHHCDRPPCCNPAHLYLGNGKENARDLRERHPERMGIPHPTKLTADDVRTIRAEFGKANIRALATRFGITQTYVWEIGRRMSGAWAWLDA